MNNKRNRHQVLTDQQWHQIEPLLPSSTGRRGRPFRNSRQIVEGIIFRYRTGIAWRDLPREQFGPWQTVWKRHRRCAVDGTWDTILTYLLTQADAADKIDWDVLSRRLDHACSSARDEHDPPGARHRGSSELQESAAVVD